MKAKLTVNIDEQILDDLRKHITSDEGISEMIENYLKEIVSNKNKKTSVVERTRGILADHYKGKSYKDIRDEMIKDKYGI